MAESHNRHAQSLGPLLGPLFGRALGVPLCGAIEYVDYHSPFCHLALRFAGAEAASRAVTLLANSSFVATVELIGGYVNLRLRPAANVEIPAYSELLGVSFAIEHTSMTPCYPINVATARSTVMGEQARRALEILGASASTRFWYEDDAHQRELVRVPSGQPSPLTLGKADHAVGRLFVRELIRRSPQGSDGLQQTLHQFDLAHTEWSERSDDSLTRALDKSEDDLVKAAYSLTMSDFGAVPDRFDTQSTVWAWARSDGVADGLCVAAEAAGVQGAIDALETPRYVIKNAAYYLYLLESYDRVLSVLPHRQRYVAQQALQLAEVVQPGAADRVSTHLYGDVTVRGETDSIRGGRFHPVDVVFDGPEARRHFWRRILSRRPAADMELSDESGESTRVAPLSVPDDASVAGILLLDELPRVLRPGIEEGRWCTSLRWIDTVMSLSVAGVPLPQPMQLAASLASLLAGSNTRAASAGRGLSVRGETDA